MLSRSSAPAGEATAGAGGSSEFAAQSLLLLLVLTNHCTVDSASGWSNPYRQSLLSFTDSQGRPAHRLVSFLFFYWVIDRVADGRVGQNWVSFSAHGSLWDAVESAKDSGNALLKERFKVPLTSESRTF